MMVRVRERRWLLVASMVGAMSMGGCAGGDLGVPEAMVVDSAGVRIVTHDLSDVDVPAYRAVGALDLEIGVQDGATEYTFSRIPDLAVFDDGSIVVSDDVAAELRLYAPDGTWLRTLGHQGDGPGEFAVAPLIAGVKGDTVFAWDGRSARVTTFTTDGTMRGMTTLQSESGLRPLVVRRLEDGTFLTQSRWRAPGASFDGPHDIRMQLDSVVVEHVDALGAPIDTLRVLPDMERALAIQMTQDAGINVSTASRPYSPRAFMMTDGAGALLGHGGLFALELRSSPDVVSTLLRVHGVQSRATASDIRAHVEADRAARVTDGPMSSFNRRLYDEFLPERLPAFDRIVLSDTGEPWIARAALDASRGADWLVFAREGELLGSVHTPPDLRLFAVRGEAIVGVALDEFDVPYVRRYPLLAPTPPGEP